MKLSDTKIKNMKPGPKRVKMADGLGLFLQVETTGGKLWRFSYRFAGKHRTISMGSYPATGLADARHKRDEARSLLASGVDPSANRKAGRLVIIAEAAEAAPPVVLPTFREVAEEFAAKVRREGQKQPTLEKLHWCLGMAYSGFGDRPIAQIVAADVLAVLRKVEAKGHYETAKRLRSICSRVFRYGVATLRCERDVASDLIGALTAPQHKAHAGLTAPKRVGGLIRAIRGFEGEPVTRTGLLLCAYTFLRPGEVRHLEWGDVDLPARRLVIPAVRMKMKTPHTVPLSDQVAGFLKAIKAVTGKQVLVLPNRRSGKPMSENTFNAALRTLGYVNEVHVSHGFRTTASTLLNEMGFNSDWIEKQLAHVEGNAVRRAYNAAQHIEGRTRMMQDYADHLDSLADAPPV